MSAIVQATCPGCKNILRIPADWVSQAIRCKHCGLVMQSKPPQSAPPVATAQRATGPKAKAPPTAEVRKSVPVAATRKAAPPEKARPATPIPVATAVAEDDSSPFAELAESAHDMPAASRPRSRRRRGSLWKGAAVAAVVLILAAVSLAFAWPKLTRLLPQNLAAFGADKDPLNVDKNENAPKEPPRDGSIPPDAKDYSASPKDKPADPNKDRPAEPPKQVGIAFPRRALMIGVHNYLFADTVRAGNQVDGAHNLWTLKNKLTTGLRVPQTEIGFLSDVAPKGLTHSPTKSVIQETLVRFLETSRAQDRILVFFVGHSVEIGDDAYLVPIEGELDKTENLIPLKWVFKQLAECKARQKVLVLDVARNNPTHGADRPGTGPLGPKFSAQLNAPPLGVQLWSACSPQQFSYETDTSPMGIFLDKLIESLEKGIPNKIQRPEETIPIQLFNEATAARMKAELAPLKLAQVPHITGHEESEGAPFNKDEPPATSPTIANAVAAKDNAKIIQSVMEEVSLPPIKPGADNSLRVDILPPFDPKAMTNYPATESRLRAEINKVRTILWAYSRLPEPADLKKDVAAKRSEFGNISMALLKDVYNYPGNEADFKKGIDNEEREISKMLGNLKRLRDDFADTSEPTKPGQLRKDEPSKRWQVNYDYVLAHLDAQIAFLYEHQAMLGGLRKEFPAKEPGTTKWYMVTTAASSLDSDGKKRAKSAAKLFDEIAEQNPNTPWFVLAKRERLVGLGLEWKSGK